MAEQLINLESSMLIGQGGHKKVYIDPRDASHCVKILFNADDPDMKKELRYRKAIRNRQRELSMIPAYYGTVETNLGLGYVFDRIFDCDGRTSRTLEEILDAVECRLVGNQPVADGIYTELPENLNLLRRWSEDCLRYLRKDFLEAKVITSNMEAANFLMQVEKKGKYHFWIADNLGSPVKIALIFYVDILAEGHVKRYWNRFVKDLYTTYPAIMTQQFFDELMV